jgi:hypothetical protein
MEFAAIFLGGVKAIGSLVSGAEESVNLKEQQRAANLSASYAADNAHSELVNAAADADTQRRRGRSQTSEQIAGFAQSGFSLTNSAADSITQSATEAELDAMNIQYKGTLRARSDLIERNNDLATADAARRARKLTPVKTAIGVGTNLLSGYSNYATGGKII